MATFTLFSSFKKHTAVLATTLALTISVATLTGCSNLQAPSPAVVTINDTVKVTQREYDKAYQELAGRLMLPASEKEEALKNKVIQEQLKQSTLNQLIFKALLKNDAKEMNITVTDADVEEFKNENFKNVGGEDNFKTLLKNEGITEKQFDANLKEELLADKFVAARAGSKVDVSETEIKDFYNNHQDQFKVPERIDVSHILFKVIERDVKKALVKDSPKITSEEVAEKIKAIHQDKKEQAQKLLTRLTKNPADFEKLAKERSEDRASATFGGDLKYMYKDTTDPVFWQAAINTKPGNIKPEVIKTQFGYHIIKLDKYEKPHTQTFAEAKEQIENMLTQQRKQQELFTWVNEKRSKAKIEFAEGFAPETPEVQSKLSDTKAGDKKTSKATVSEKTAEPVATKTADQKG